MTMHNDIVLDSFEVTEYSLFSTSLAIREGSEDEETLDFIRSHNNAPIITIMKINGLLRNLNSPVVEQQQNLPMPFITFCL